MNYKFLKINRFEDTVNVATAQMTFNFDDSTVAPAAKNIENAMNKIDSSVSKVIDSQDKMRTSSTNMASSLSKIASTALTNYNNAISQMKKLMSTPEASTNFKINAQTTIDKSAISNLGAQNASQMDETAINKTLSATNVLLKRNATEYDRQTKLIEKQIAAEDNVIAKEHEKSNLINQLTSSVEQYGKQQEIEDLKRQSNLETINNLLREQNSLETTGTNDSVMESATAYNYLKNAVNGYSKMISFGENQTAKFGNSFKNSILKLRSAAVTFRILYGTFRQVWNVMAGTVEEAANYEEALNLYTVAMGEYAEQARAWSDEIAQALYLDPKQIMQYTGALYNLVQGLGVSSKAAYVMSTNLTQLAYDMSSYLNIDVESAYAKLQSAMTGQSRAVASAGIAMQQASLQELAYSLGIRQNVADMTQAEKTYLRYIQIMRSTSNMQGDLARTLISPQNALRVIQQQFTLLARAIGQVFIPIIMSAIPYVMALTQALTRLAAALGKKLGYEVTNIDYSGLKTLDTAVGTTFNNIGTGAGKAAKSTGKAAKSVKDSINDALASFDDLNTVITESSGGGSGGGVGGVGGGIGGVGGIGGIPLDDYITGYDMLDGLTDRFSDKVAEASKKLEELWKWIKIIAAAWGLWKIAKATNSLIGFIQSVARAYTEGTGLAGLIGTLVRNFAEGTRLARALGYEGLEAVAAGFRMSLPPAVQFLGVLASATTAFFLSKNAMDEWDGSVGNMIGNITLATVEVGALTAVGALFAGSLGAVVVATAGVTGGLVGLTNAVIEYRASLVREEKYAELFDGVGASVEAVSKSFSDGVDKIVDYGETLDKLEQKVEDTTQNVDDAGVAFGKLHNSIISGTASGDAIERLRNATERYKEAVNANRDAHIAYNDTVIANLKEEGVIGQDTYNRLTKNAREHYTTVALYQSKYGEELSKLDIQLQNGSISQEEYNKRLNELKQEYAGIVDPIKSVSDGIASVYMASAEKINLEEPKKIKELVDNLSESYKKGKQSIEEQRKTAEEYYSTQKYSIQGHIDALEKVKNKNKEQESMLASYKTQLSELTETYNYQTAKFESDSETLGATYKNYLTTIYAQIAEAGLTGDKQIKGSVATIKSEMENLSSFDTSKSIYDLFGKMTNTFQKEGKTFEVETMDQFGKWGIKFDKELYDKLINGHRENFHKLTDKIKGDVDSATPGIGAKYGELGKKSSEQANYELKSGLVIGREQLIKEMNKTADDISSGYTNGLTKNKNKWVTTTTKMGEEGVINPFREKLGIRSPSTVFENFGYNIVIGLKNGIDKNRNVINDSINSMINGIKDKLKSTNVSLKINTNVESSFNSILSKLQTFINSWRSSINKMLSNTKESLNSVSLNKKTGNVTYSSFGAVSVPKFAQGGYPTSGDLFFANENGVPEYITSIGNRSAVINQDQMVSALSNAIVQGMSSLSKNEETGDIIVNIGNETVYRGAIKYTNRQRNIYGTNVV